MWLWIVFTALVLFLLWLDLFVLNRHSHVIGAREAIGWSTFWISLGLSFSGVIYLLYEYNYFGGELAQGANASLAGDGGQAVVLYLTGYLLEESLSVDNLFVMALIMATLKVPARFQHRVLFWGIIGALVMRFLMITGGIWLVTKFDWMFYLFGGFLVFSGIKMLVASEPDDVTTIWWMRLIRRVVPVTDIDDGRFFVREAGRLAFTPLALALIAVETADVIFAVDSVPAILAVTTEPFIVVSSNVFAILGLRSLYFVLASMLREFRYLELALSILLVMIGVKMVVHKFVHIPHLASLLGVVGIVGIGIVASVIADRRDRASATVDVDEPA